MIMKLTPILCSLFLLGAVTARADLYQWKDEQGVTHVVDDASAIPEAYRDKVKTYSAPKSANSSTGLLAASRVYPPKSQGAFAQKLALDLGLIRNLKEDAIGPLGVAAIQPAGGWQVNDPLTPEVRDQIVAAARRAAESQRVRLSADGAEAIVQQAANDYLPPPPVAQTLPPAESFDETAEYDDATQVIVEQQPPQVIEVIREPVYVPAPVIVGVPYWDGGGHRGGHSHPQPPREGPRSSAPASPAIGPTHMPFGASHMPFGTSHMPFGSKR